MSANTPDAQTFVQRYFALLDDDVVGTSERGNPLPILLTTGMAYVEPLPDAAPLPLSFYEEVNRKFQALEQDAVAFPTNMFEDNDVCVMSRSLFVDLVDKNKTDDEAGIVLDHAHTADVRTVKDQVKKDPSNVETIV